MHCRFIALMPQWDFLNFLAEKGKRFPTSRLLMKTQGTGIVLDDGRVTGVVATDDDGSFTIAAKLVVGTDGRRSTMRERAGMTVENLGAPMDVLWMRITKHAGDPVQPLGSMRDGRISLRRP